MKQLIILPVKTMSINSTYYANKLHGKTAEAREWSEQVLVHLSKYNKELQKFSSSFDTTKHMYSIEIQMLVPSDVLYTKKGEFTSKVHDLSNIEKSLIDLLFLPKFYDEQNCTNLNIDDRYLGELKSVKLPTLDTWGVQIIVELKNRPEPILA